MSKAPLPQTVAIVGSRDYPNLQLVRDFVQSLPKGSLVISAGARGVDFEAALRARKRPHLGLRVFKPSRNAPFTIIRYDATSGFGGQVTQWSLSGEYKSYAQACHARNGLIISEVVANTGALVCFWDGASTGTASMIERGKKNGVLHTVYGPTGEELTV